MSTITTTINRGVTLGTSGYYSPLTVTNTGAINNHGTGQAIFGGTATVVNDGHITATSGTVTVAGIPTVFAYSGVYLSDAGSFVDNSGTITGSLYAARLTSGGGVTNSGVLYGGKWGVTSRALITVTNTGTISGGSQGIVLSGGGFVSNGGLISGADGIGIGGGAGTVDNAGTIVSYGAGVALNAGGVVSNAGTGLISVTGNYAAVYNTGGAGSVTNAGTLFGYLGASFVGAYNNRLIDTGTIIGSGGTAIAFGAGNDLLQFQPATSVFIRGTVDGGGGTNTLEFASALAVGTLTGSGADFVNFAHATVDAGASWVFAGTNTLGASINLVDAGKLTNAGSLVADPPITVTGTFINSSIVSAPGSTESAFYVASGGVLTNTATGIITAGGDAVTAAGTVSISNLGSIVGVSGSGIDVNASSGNLAFIDNASGGVIGSAFGISAGYLTLTNRGTIQGTGTHATGVFLAAGGNDGVIANYGLLTGTYYGIHSIGNGSLNNSGTIASTGRYGVRFDGGTPSVTNSGTISGNNGLVMLANGAVTNTGTGLITGLNALGIRGTGLVVNSATIDAANGTGVQLGAGGMISNAAGGVIIGGSYDAVYIGGGAGTVINHGTIAGGTGIAFYSGPSAGTLSETVIDSGAIAGTRGAAIAFGGGDDLLQFQPSASVFIQGTVDGGGGINTLEFTSGATTGTLTGDNASFTNFAIGTVDAGASWVLAGNVTFGSGITLADNSGFTLAESGTLVNTGVITEDLTSFSIRGGGTAALLDNLGSIQAYDIGVSLERGGTIINGASGNTTALISGNYGVYAASGLIGNYGTIYASGTGSESVLLGGTGQVSNHAGGLITGDNIGVDLSNGTATLTNFGVVSAANNGVLALHDGDVLMNGPGALIAGTRAVLMAAAVTTPVSDTLTNYGTITGQYGVIAGVIPATGTLHTTIVDAGTIIGTGGTAIAAVATIASASVDLTLRLLAGNDFIQGAVVGEAYGTGVLDFVSGSGSGTLTGSGADFINFQTASVDTGANWTFAGTNTLGANTTLVDAGTLTNVGSINGDLTLSSGVFVNAAGGYVQNAYIYGAPTGGPDTVTNLGAISASSGYAIYFRDGGIVSNAATGLINGPTGVRIAGAEATVTNLGTINAYQAFPHSYGVYLSNGGLVGNGAAGDATASIRGYYGIGVASAPGTVVNYATIAATATTGAAIVLHGGGRVTNRADATISGNMAITAGAAATLVDAGTIVGSGGTAIAFAAGNDLVQFQPGSVFLQGTVDAGGSANTLEFASAAATGTLTGANAYFINFANGTVDAGANWGLAGSNTLGASTTLTDGGTLTNRGTLTNNGALTDTGTLVNDGGITALGGSHVGVDVAQGGTLSNLGSISAPAGYGVDIIGAGLVTNGASGSTGATISALSMGIQATGTATATVVNYGLVVASANRGVNAYETLALTNRGRITGTGAGIELGDGGSIGNYGTINATYIGLGAAGIFVKVGGVVNNGIGGVISSPESAVRIDPQNVASTTITNYGTLEGGFGVSVYSGNTLSQTLIDGGTIIGSSGTAVALGSGDDLLRFVAGDPFIQGTVDGGGGSNTLQFASGATTGTLTGAGADFLNFQTASVAAGVSWVLAGSNTLGASTALVDAGTLTNAGYLLADPPVTVTGTFINSSIVSAPDGTALYVANGGVVTNAAGGTITGYGIGVSAAGTAAIDNFGIIQGSTFAAIRMASGSVVNGGIGATTAEILGSGYGVRASGVATVTNYGTITASNQDGVFLAAGGSLANHGIIAANEYGVLLYGPGAITNLGTISASGGGIITNNTTNAVVTNTGIITGGAGPGIVLQAGGTVVDSGTITSGYFAVLFRGVASNLLVLENGYSLSGPVGGSASASSNVVELLGTSAANAVTASFNGLNLTNVGTIAFAPGAGNYATWQITNDATLPGTIANFTGPHDTIDLTTLAYVTNSSIATFNSGSRQITVTNGTNTVTLTLGGGSYSGLGFGVHRDGSSGTDVTVGPAALTYSWIGGSADWQTATNWSSGVIPGVAASAIIANAGSNTVTISSGETIQVAGVTLANGDTLLDAGTFASGITLGSATAAVSIAVGGVVNNASGDGIYGLASNTGSVSNFGTVIGGGTGASGFGVQLLGAGSVTNGSAADTTATIQGYRVGVTIAGAAQISNYGTISGIESVIVGGDATIANHASGRLTNGVNVGGAGSTVENAGTISGIMGVYAGAGDIILNGSAGAASAVISGGAAGIEIISSLSGSDTIVNYGTIAGGDAIAIYPSAGTLNATIVDAGTIVGSTYALLFGGYEASSAVNLLLRMLPGQDFIAGRVAAVRPPVTATLEFASGAGTGTLTGAGADFINFATAGVDAGASWVFAGSNTLGAGTTLVDAGTLTNTGSLVVDPPLIVSGTLVNSNTIAAPGTYDAVSLLSTGVVTNAASGLISGGHDGILGGGAAALIDNLGTIAGVSGNGVDLTAGAVINGAATVTNALISGAGFGVAAFLATTVTNYGTISGGNFAGVDLESGGSVLNRGLISSGAVGLVLSAAGSVANYGTITGTLGFSGSFGAQTLIDSGTIIGTGGTAVALGTAASLLQFNPGHPFIGGTVIGSGTASTLEFATGGAGTLTGAGADFINFATAGIDAGASWVLAGSNTLGSSVNLVDAGTLTNFGSLVVDPPITVTGTFVNAGTLSLTAGSYIVQLAPGGYFLNTTAGVVARPNGGGTYAPAIYSETGGTSRVVNLGTISSDRFNVGVKLNAGGTVVNGAANATSALMYGGFPVLIQGAAGTVANYGTLLSVPGFGGSGVVLNTGGAVNNGIGGSTAALIAGDSNGVKLAGGGTVLNFGTISGHNGIYARNVAATVMNSGSIAGSAGYGVYLEAGGTVTDAGSISGSTGAVAFGGASAGLLILEHGYSLHGVRGSGGASATVELLGTSVANAVTATYNTLGLTNFSTIAFAPVAGNYATLKITNDGTLPHTIANFTGLHDTIDLTTLAFVSGSSSATFNTGSDQITAGYGTNFVTLQLGSGTYTGVGFTAVSDGATGTDIIVGPGALTYAWIGPSADWKTATDWSSGIIPGVSASATIADAGNNTVTISNGETIQVAAVTLSNSNTLNVAGTLSPTGAINIAGAVLSVSAGGLITHGGSGTLIGGTGVVSNDGTISGGNHYGISLTGTVLNQGSINATVTATTIVNRGTISNTTAFATGVIGNHGAFAAVINGASGATNALIEGADTGVNLNGGSSGGTVVNYGTVIGGAFVGVDLYASGGTVGLSNYGTILAGGGGLAYAAVHVASAAIINNTGVIEETAAGADGVYVRSNPGVTNIGLNLNNSGLITAAGHAVEANSTIPVVVTNSGTLIGSEGFAVFSTVATSQTLIDSGTIIGTSGTAVAFGAGNDLLQFQSSTSAFIQGTVDGAGGTNTLEFASGASAGTLTGSNAYFLNFANGTVDTGADWVLAGSNTIGASVTLANAGTLTDIGSLSNAGLISGVAAVALGGNGNVAMNVAAGSLGNTGAIAGGFGGVGADGLDTTGGSGGSGGAGVELTGGGSLNNSGTVYGGAGGGGGAASVGFDGGDGGSGGIGVDVVSGSLANASAIAGGNGGSGGLAVGGAGASGGAGGRGGIGVDVASASFTNTGAITGGSGGTGGAGVSGASGGAGGAGGAGLYLTSGSLTNNSAITGGAGGFGGVGSADGVGGIGGDGVTIAAGYLTNNGRIAGGAGGAAGGIGVAFRGSGTLVDSGTIIGTSTAVAFGGTTSNLLILEHGYSISGQIIGSASASDTLELLGTSAANAVTATYNTLGLTNFGTVAFAPAATNYATLKITNDATLPGTITNFTGAHDTIDLTTLAFVSGSSTATFNAVSDQLTVGNGTNSVTLQLGSGSYIGFGVNTDGAIGTDVTVGPALTYAWIGPSADWNTATNWSSGIIPGVSASATIADAGNNTVTIGSSESIAVTGVTISNSDTLLVAGTFAPTGLVDVTGALLSVASTGTVTNFSALTDAGTLINAGTIGGGGTLTVDGTLTNAGTISFNGTTSGSVIQMRLYAGASVTNLSGATIGLVNANYGAVTPVLYGTGGPVTVTNLGTIRHGEVGVSLANGGRVVNGAPSNAAALIATYDGILSGNTGGVTVANYGTMSSGHVALGLGGGGVVINGATNATAALLTGEDGVVFYGRAGTVINFGTIVGATHGSVIYTDGVFMGYGSGGTVIDGGTIMGSRYAVDFGASPTPGRYGIDGNNQLKLYAGADLVGKVFAAGTGNVLELASGGGTGTINGIGTTFRGLGTITVDAGASWVLTGSNTLGAGYTLTDAGTLTNTGTLVVDPPLIVSGTLVNSNTIAAPGTYDAVSLLSTGVITNTAAGIISGGHDGVLGGGASALIDNLGTITGASGNGVDLTAGAVINGAATVTNALISGAGFGVASFLATTVTNYGTIIGGSFAGVDLESGGSVLNRGLISGAATGLVLSAAGSVANYGTITGTLGFSGNSGAQTLIDSGTIIGTGGTAVALGTAASLLQFNSGHPFIGGTVIGSGTASTLEFAAGGAGTLTGANADFVNFATATVGAGANWSLAGSNTLGSGVTLQNTGTLDNTGTLWLIGPLQNSGRLINDGSIDVANYGGLQLAAGSYLRNDASDAITRGTIGSTSFNSAIIGLAGGGSTIVNYGTIRNSPGDAGIYLRGGGIITNGAATATSAVISATVAIYISGAAATVSNFATISGAAGVELYDGGTVTNGAPGSTAALISASQYGVVLDHTGTFSNFGTVIGATDVGLRMRYGGVATNAGQIIGSYGIVVESGQATISNSSTIAGSSHDGIKLAAGGTVIDSGTIIGTGGTAVAFGGTGNLLVLEHGYAITGAITASGTGNTVELLGTSAAVTATYNSLGLVNFGTIEFAPSIDNSATLVLLNDTTLPGTIADFTAPGDFVDLRGLADTGSAVATLNGTTDVLTVVSNGGTVALQLDSENYSGVGFVTSADGSGGTDIHPQSLGTLTISGTQPDQAISDAQTITPFGTVSIADPNGNQIETITITLSAGDADGTLAGSGLSKTAPGTYSLTANGTAAADAALRSLVFTPTDHQVAPGNTVTTTFALNVTDSANESGSDDSTSVVATAVANAPTISGAVGNQGVPSDATGTPFASVVISDVDAGAIDTVSIALANPAGGTLSNLSGGSFNNGTYTVTGTPTAVTSAVDSLEFTPAAPAVGFVATTGFTIFVTGAGGTVSDSTTDVTSVQQVLFLGAMPANQIAIDVTPDGTGIRNPENGFTNESVIRNPVAGGYYLAPEGYRAAFLDGSAGAALSDNAAGNVLLVGNTGNDTLVASAANDTILGGSGSNEMFGGSGALLLSNGAQDTVAALAGGATVQSSGADPLVFGDFTSAAGALNVSVSGAQATVSSGNSNASVTTGGSNALVYGGFGTAPGALNVVDTGSGDTISAGDSNTSVTLASSGALVFGRFGGSPGGLNVTDAGSGDTISTGDSPATITGGASGLLVFGGTGTLDFVGGSGPATLAAGSGAATVTGGAGGTTLYGAVGGADAFYGAGPLLYVAGSGNETLNAGGSTGGDTLVGGSNASSTESIAGGSGNDTLFAGAGAETLAGGGGGNIFSFVSSLTDGNADVIADFNGNDLVYLTGYGANDAATAVNAAASSGGNTTITLADNTRITFLGMGSAAALQGHVFSG